MTKSINNRRINDYKEVVIPVSFTVAVAGTNLGVGSKIWDAPLGFLLVEGGEVDLQVTAHTGCTVNPEWGLGSVVASGAVTGLGGTATFENIMDGQQLGALTAAVEKDYGNIAFIGQTDEKDGTATAVDVYLNLAGGWTTTGNITVDGTVTLRYKVIAD